jgi:hypothetical protein
MRALGLASISWRSMLAVPKCDLCGSDENVLVDHYEDHIKRRLNICMKCHASLHMAIYFHAYDSLWSEGYGDPLKREYYERLHRVLVDKGLIRCNECKPSSLSLLEKYFDEELKKPKR